MRIIVNGVEQPTRKPAERDHAEQRRPRDDRPRDRALMSWVPKTPPRRRGIERSR